MNAVAQAWHRLSRVSPVLPAETDEAARIVSRERIPFSEALAMVQARRYAAEQGPCEVITNYANRRG